MKCLDVGLFHSLPSLNTNFSLLWILHQQTPYEVFSQLTGVTEILLIKVIVDG